MSVDRVEITEVGPREGFQFEGQGVATAGKIELINTLAKTGLKRIQAVSFVSPKMVPHVADAEEIMAAVDEVPGVEYEGLWFNLRGFERARATGRVTLDGQITVSASDKFAQQNWRTDSSGLAELNRDLLSRYRDLNLPVGLSVAAAFGCNFQGRVEPSHVLDLINEAAEGVARAGLTLEEVALADTMAWANPLSIVSLIEAVRGLDVAPGLRLHLHDTRGLGLANAYAALSVGVRRFDTAIAGLGGCPFAGHKGAAGNIATEDFVLLCHEVGLKTGVHVEALLEAAHVAESVVGHPAASRSLKGGHLPRGA